jgi:telomere length regulation protein
MSSITYLFLKLANVGAFPASKPTSPSQPSFFLSPLPTIRRRLSQGSSATASYSSFWSALLESLPSSFTLQNILASLFAHISVPDTPLDISPSSRALVKREAGLLLGIVGSLREDKTYIRDSTSAVLLARDWGEGHARVYACWAAGTTTGVVDVHGEHPLTCGMHASQLLNCSCLRVSDTDTGSVDVSGAYQTFLTRQASL